MRSPTLTIGDVHKLPAVLTPARYAEAFGYNKRSVQRMCQEGRIPYAHMVNGAWYIPTSKALESFGIIDGGEA